MAQIKPEWIINGEAETLVRTLCDLYPEKLGHIDSNKIGCAAIANKEQPETKTGDATLVGVSEPTSLYCTKSYIIWFYMNIWEEYTPAQRSFMLMKQLLRIPEDYDGSILKEDLKDVKCLVKTWGVDYMDNPGIPDLSTAKQVF